MDSSSHTWAAKQHGAGATLELFLLGPCPSPIFPSPLALLPRLYLRGLLPPAVLSQEVQLERCILNIRSKPDMLDRYNYMSSLQGRNERLFYR